MRTFIFITTEGTTLQPSSTTEMKDIENCQVIGYSDGENEQIAFDNLINENDYLLDTSFDEVICLELKSEKRTYFYLKEVAV